LRNRLPGHVTVISELPRRLQLAAAVVALLALLTGLEAAAWSTQPASAPPTLADWLPQRTDAIAAAIARHITGEDAMNIVLFMDRFWRVAANPGFLASQDHIRERLIEAGYADGASGASRASVAGRSGVSGEPRVWYEEFPAETPGWDHSRGTLSLVLPSGDLEVLLSQDQHRVALCINSFPTPAGGRTLRVIDVGNGSREEDFEGKIVAGALVLGDGPVERLWEEAVRRRGAAGVVSTAIDDFVTRPAPGVSADEILDTLQWGTIPYDPALKSFAFKATPRAARRLRDALASGPLSVNVEIESRFYDGPNRTLLAEIPGHAAPSQRIVLVAHVQEPGANDNGSGCGTLFEIAAAIARAIRDDALPPPDRTLTFLWTDESRGSERWLAVHPDLRPGVRYMIALDMTGEDTAKTGGSFRIEKQPDPSAVWELQSDPHTEWGNADVKAEALRGTLLNDVHLAVSQRIGAPHGWPIATNPYEGGSDHTTFNDAGIPAVLDWHFTDRYYHTNLDRPDKVSTAEMKNVGIAAGTTAALLASADVDDARAIVRLIGYAAGARLDLETRQAQVALDRADEPAVTVARAVFGAWKKWYQEALASVLTLPARGADEDLRRQVAEAAEKVRTREVGGRR
jgi:hypothetical protein